MSSKSILPLNFGRWLTREDANPVIIFYKTTPYAPQFETNTYPKNDIKRTKTKKSAKAFYLFFDPFFAIYYVFAFHFEEKSSQICINNKKNMQSEFVICLAFSTKTPCI